MIFMIVKIVVAIFFFCHNQSPTCDISYIIYDLGNISYKRFIEYDAKSNY